MIDSFLMCAAVVAFFAITPGPDTALILSQIMRFKASNLAVKSGLFTCAGIASGLIIHCAAVAFGLGALFVYVPLAYTIMKWAGALYLLFIAGKILHQTFKTQVSLALQDVDNTDVREIEKINYKRSFITGFITNVLNPKAIIFFSAILPQFVDLSGVSGGGDAADDFGIITQMIALSVTAIISAFIAQSVLVIVIVLMKKAVQKTMLGNKSWILKIQNVSLAVVFAGFALKLIASKPQ